MYLIGYDIGSSSVKASLLDLSGNLLASDHSPKTEMSITAKKDGWAEQDPEEWWTNLKYAHNSVVRSSGVDPGKICGIGISWQMHGLVMVDKERKLLRDSIIWCDSRAVPYGRKAFGEMGAEHVLPRLLNSPGNFTAAKLAWVKDNEPWLYERVDKIMLPGDYIAMKLTGDVTVTAEGLSEGILWDFKTNSLSDDMMHYFGFDRALIPELVPIFGTQGTTTSAVEKELGIKTGTPVTYRAGDQPNNALALNVLRPGEMAATAGTSGVVYGVLDKVNYDPGSRVNTFVHVNHSAEQPRLGVLLCINGTGILNSWVRKNFASDKFSYAEMNQMAELSPIGANGLTVIPFGNGSERMLDNQYPGCSFNGINFNIHNVNDIFRAVQEGIVFSFMYGMDIMRGMGMNTGTIKAGNANMFLSPLFRQALSSLTGSVIELYDTDGAAGAARGAGIGLGLYGSTEEAFASLRCIEVVEPVSEQTPDYMRAYEKWEKILNLSFEK